jgi:hypothetical protein
MKNTMRCSFILFRMATKKNKINKAREVSIPAIPLLRR